MEGAINHNNDKLDNSAAERFAYIRSFNTGNDYHKMKIRFVYSNPFIISCHSRTLTFFGIISVKSSFNESDLAYEWFGINKPTVTYEPDGTSSRYAIIDFGTNTNYIIGNILSYIDQIRSVEYIN